MHTVGLRECKFTPSLRLLSGRGSVSTLSPRPGVIYMTRESLLEKFCSRHFGRTRYDGWVFVKPESFGKRDVQLRKSLYINWPVGNSGRIFLIL